MTKKWAKSERLVRITMDTQMFHSKQVRFNVIMSKILKSLYSKRPKTALTVSQTLFLNVLIFYFSLTGRVFRV